MTLQRQKRHTIYMLISLLLAAVILTQSMSVNSLSKIGSQSDEVSKIQTALKEQGYYKGKADGIFGTATKNAVISFQSDNGLSADGIVGTKTLNALGIGTSNTSGVFSDSELALLARIISAEARGEPYEGQVAVGAVILNRIGHPSFPNTLAGVIYQPSAFTCVVDGQINVAVSDSAKKAATDAINGWDPSGGAIYYYNPKTATNKWIQSRSVLVVIGDRMFCS